MIAIISAFLIGSTSGYILASMMWSSIEEEKEWQRELKSSKKGE